MRAEPVGTRPLPARRRHPPATQGAQLEAWLQDLLCPISLQGSQQQLPSLAALPLTAQANLLLLVRAAPHRFSAAQRAALLEGFAQLAPRDSGGPGSTLLQLLAAGADSSSASHQDMPPPVPACPSFLYTAQPCFPWAPVLADQATAKALQKRQAAAAARQQQEQRQAAATGGKRPGEAGQGAVEGSATKRQRQAAGGAPQQPASTAAAAEVAADAQLDSAIGTVQAALNEMSSTGSTALPPQLRQALDVLLAHAAAGSAAGAAALQAAGLDTLQDDSLLLLLLTDLMTASSSFARGCAVARGLLLPRLLALQATASRDLAAAAEHVGAWWGHACCWSRFPL